MIGFKILKLSMDMELERYGKRQVIKSEIRLADENAPEKFKHTFRNFAVWHELTQYPAYSYQ